ncbi:MAG: glycoside hydrolase family 2 TIM barrel-domain containing protein, partial [Spirochaetales bacterium]
MRTITSLNADWQFSKDDKTFEHVNLPHTWNNFDGQDGEGDYLRQKCFYKKELAVTKSDKKVFIEFEGANHIANVYFNGTHLGEHRGGFSTFRFELTDYIGEKNLLEVHVDNSEEIPVYPQQADFTFFGGLYRNVNLIEVPQTHFDLDFYGSQGIYITPTVKNNAATIDVLAYTKGESGKEVVFTVCDADGKEVAQAKSHTAQEVKVSMSVENPVLWNGVKNPYLYTLRSEITDGESGTDTVSISFGIRSFSVDNDKGFILNGTECPLHGVSRHQDKLDKGWALLPEDHETDIAIIKEMGANTIRLAHYQHCQYFYDLCDKDGFVVWAEIPFITMFMSEKEAQENTVSQMKELVLQNYNHPSICFWGISNEITIGGENDALVENQKTLVNVIKQYDTTRLTTIANVSFVPPESSQNQLTDIIGYNHYFGWYGGELTQNEEWIDEFHKNYPTRPLCISEYGAEG